MLAQSPPYFEHDADIGIIGRGATLEQAFEAAAQAVFGIMTSLEKVQSEDCELALITWLNLLLGKARELGMVFGRFHLRHQGTQWQGEISGEKWREGLDRGVEVKGATLTMLSVKQGETMWEVRCIVDV